MLQRSACQTCAPFFTYSWTRPRGTPLRTGEGTPLFLAENHGLRFRAAVFHPFTLSCAPIQQELELTDWLGQQDHIICKKQRPDPKVTKLDPINTLDLDRIGNKDSPGGVPPSPATSPTYCQQGGSNSISDYTGQTDSPTLHNPGESSTGFPEGCSWIPSPDPQKACRLVGQLPRNLKDPAEGVELIHCSTSRTKTTSS